MEMKQNNNHALTAMDDYINKVYHMVLLLIPGACQCAGLLYTFEKIMGWLPTVEWMPLIIFDVTCLIYLGIGFFFVMTGSKNGVVKPGKLLGGKIYVAIIMIIQWNFIQYLIPATDFWGFAFFFVILTAFFLDIKLVAVVVVEILGSTVAAWFIGGQTYLPAQDDMFLANLLDRIVCLALSLPTIWLLTFFVSKFLVNAKKDELQRNNEQVQNVLSSVRSMSENLFNAGSALAKVTENENESADILSATSDELMQSSNLLGRKADESLQNLNELSSWEEVVSTNVEMVENTSHELLEKSSENAQVLQQLKSINGDVSQSMVTTVEVTRRLSEAVEEIAGALKLINKISTSTHLLSLNASIEAARAGAAGKGFAVVAQEVGSLANESKASLTEIEKILARVQDNVNAMMQHVEDNSDKLDKQNEHFNNVFAGMSEMTELINTSMKAIDAMGDARNKQGEVIRNTVSISKDIAESIRDENVKFNSINSMVESNVADIAEMSKQVSAINTMVDDINNILNK